ncbi:DEAD/DEAH box helicase [Methanoplanus limicola]|uniref:DEAD/DEAH box helicase domain protein n=1 Tax=Methanoplanus limicola DSM 2279 TaxID=937775 RepID=H1Z481_9EURY|nr:DEAD/DEAH box helicase [Methanoplanus limicola]EHQ36629.1 DEAD/DEAH box helicase domain protein [Methanoplanus limicola DSM 2279]
MKIIISPNKSQYSLFFYNRQSVTATGTVELSKTSRGYRPKNFRMRQTGGRHYKNTPTKDLINLLRHADIRITSEDKKIESFLSDLQIKFARLTACRICLVEDRITPLKKKNSVSYGKEKICLDCAKKELRRELGFMGGMGIMSTDHLERLLELYMDLDRVLGIVQPENPEKSNTLFDTLEAHEIKETTALKDLPLPKKFIEASGVENLMPVQELCVKSGLLSGRDILAVAATASGKTFIGEMAGIKNHSEGRGNMLFLVPLVALANQKYSRFTKRYPYLNVALKTGVSRLNIPETKIKARRNIESSIIVGTYEGIDHHLRLGRELRNIGTVVIDEVQTLEDPERGHRLDGLIARLKKVAPQAQYLYLSATIGLPHLLAGKLNAELVSYAERPVALERHLIFLEKKQKVPTIKRMVNIEFQKKSSKGYRGQTIVFTNSRAKCHEIAAAIGNNAAPYHAGLTAKEKHEVEDKFENGKISAVVTTAALAAGVDFPASQVIFESLAMGIEWLKVQEFLQMMGRAGRPDYHDTGKVVILAEPGASYSRETKITEEEVAINLLKGEMFEVAPVYDDEQSSEEFAANAIVCKGNIKDIEMMQNTMVGEMQDIAGVLKNEGLITYNRDRITVSPLAKIMAEHFIGIERLRMITKLVKVRKNPVDIIAELDCPEDD